MSQPLFRFAVIADTHVNPTDDESNSPWEVNRWANARTRRILAHVSAENPEFVVHLGDMVHPVPGTSTYSAAAQRFFGLTAGLSAPLHYVPGNHDAGDKPVDWAPANPINDSYLELYEQTFGTSYYSFDHSDCHFVVINTMLINSGMDAEAAQRDWLEDDLALHEHGRTFVFGHYPLYLARREEPECYDNVGEPGRTWLLDLLSQHGVEAYLAGHVHNFFYNRHDGTDHYVLPSTSFVRHDYSELARVEPGPQYGRDDGDKLGYLVVEIRADHHTAQIVRSHHHATVSASVAPAQRVSLRHDATVPVGVDMRQHWAEIVPLPYNGMLDEFVRRNIRNDYPLLALWELGVQALRIPLNDLTDPALASRMRELSAAGHRFYAFSYDIPTGEARAAVADCADTLAGVEVVIATDGFDDRKAAIAELRSATNLPVTISPLRTSAHTAHSDSAVTRFAHHVHHGFDPDSDVSTLDADAVAFRVPATRPPWQGIAAASAAAARHQVRATVHVTLAGEDPAVDASSDAATANRVAEAMLAAWWAHNTLVFLDTLPDVDRGYFPRRGLTDRRFNLRLAGSVYRHLNAALAHTATGRTGAGTATQLASGRVCSVGDGELILILPTAEIQGRELAERFVLGTTSAIVDLASGTHDVKADPTARKYTVPTLIVRTDTL